MPTSADLPTLPFEQSHPLEVAPLRRRLQAEGPVHRVRTPAGDEAWLVTDYDHVRTLLGDDRLGLSHPNPDSAARLNDSTLFGGRPRINYETEHADQARFRARLQPFFAPKRMRALRPRVRALAVGLLDDLGREGPPADLHQALSVPLALQVICELLGVPGADRDRLHAHSQAAAAADNAERSRAGMARLWEYTRQLVAFKRAHPGDDVISGLCMTEGGTIGDEEIAMIAAMTFFAGHETTVAQIDYGAVLVLTNTDQHETLAADPTLLPSAVEECLRAANSGGVIPRYPRTDIDIGGARIPAGDLVLLDTGAANHDENVFADSDRFEVARSGAAHLSFGHGAHYCLGSSLARIELEAAFEPLIDRFPAMRLAVSIEELRLRTDLLTGGLAELPVTW